MVLFEVGLESSDPLVAAAFCRNAFDFHREQRSGPRKIKAPLPFTVECVFALGSWNVWRLTQPKREFGLAG
jgi:hypothetical protein